MRLGKRFCTQIQSVVGVCLLLATLACNSASSSSSLPEVTFENKSNTNKTYDVIWDGSRVGTIGPGQTTKITTAAGQHTLVFQISNSNTGACSTSTPVLALNVNYTFSCSG